jgi:hypothetical protein
LKNKYEVRGEITAIFLTKKDGTILETIISTSGLRKSKRLFVALLVEQTYKIFLR